MKPLSDAIWHTRLQVLWIVLSAVYGVLAKSWPERRVSSVLIVVAGTLLVALLGHVLFKTYTKSKSVLLVAFGSSVFLATVSVRDFDDPLATCFAIIFAAMTGSLLYFELSGTASQRLRYRYFVAIVFTLVAAGIGFPLTLLQKALLQQVALYERCYLVGIQGVAAVACFGLGLVAGRKVLPSTIPHNRSRHLPSWPVVLIAAAAFPAALFFGLYSSKLVTVFGDSLSAAVLFVLVYSAGLIAVPAFVLIQVRSWRGAYPWRPAILIHATGAVVGMALAVAAITEALTTEPSVRTWVARAAIVDVPSFLAVFASVLLGVGLARGGVRSARVFHKPARARRGREHSERDRGVGASHASATAER